MVSMEKYRERLLTKLGVCIAVKANMRGPNFLRALSETVYLNNENCCEPYRTEREEKNTDTKGIFRRLFPFFSLS